jgi:ribonuclease R
MSRRSEYDLAPFLDLLQKRAPRPLTIPEMARLLDLDPFDIRTIRALLEAEVARNRLRRIGKTRYQWRREEEAARAKKNVVRRGGSVARVEGHYSRVRAGYGFVAALGRAADRYPRDILIPNGEEGAALHGDRVIVEITGRDARRHRVSGRIVEVTNSVHERVVGALEPGYRGWLLIPDSDLLPPVEIVGGETPGADARGRTGLVRLTRPGATNRAPAGVLERILGDADEPDVQFLSIALEHGLRIEFPEDVEAAAAALPTDPDATEYAGRVDLRERPLVTIDGETARDFDDAVCVETNDSGFRVWVAIADVAHYVRPGSPIDREAALRGTSVYFPDRAIPMLPPRLSNELCSLNPDRDRFVLVAEMDLDGRGVPLDARFYRAVMRSRARLTYAEVAAALDGGAVRPEVSALLPQLQRMHALMKILYQRRRLAGSLDLDLPEALIELSEEGRSVGIRVAARNDAHRIIEELMLAANQAVAGHLRDLAVPLPYRIHEPPDPDDVDELNQFLGPFGFHVDYERSVRPADVQKMLASLGGHALSQVLSRQVLRSLTKAQYSTNNAGHFGLAFPVYCHFTSPIRRYPDLLVHRQLGRVFDGDIERAREFGEEVEAASVASSQSEREAMEAERAMVDLKKAEFMRDHLHEPGPGTIVSVTSFGFFVEFDAWPVEGLVRLDSLDDFYEYVEAERALRARRKGRRFGLGDRVEVEAVDVSLRRRTIDLVLRRRLPR